MDQTLFNEFKVAGINRAVQDNVDFHGSLDSANETFQQDENSITVQRRRAYLMEMNDDFDIQQVFKEISWQNKQWTE